MLVPHEGCQGSLGPCLDVAGREGLHEGFGHVDHALQGGGHMKEEIY